jgi:NAD(P)H dehydrogenase (quinone)
MKHAVIFAHPNQKSFTASVAAAYTQAAEALGHDVVPRDLYRMHFDPRLQADELFFSDTFRPGPDVMVERKLLEDADVYALFYPLWLNTPPAILKGYLERVFGYGFAYGKNGRDAEPLLKGRKLITFSSSGAPFYWVKETGNFEAIKTLFDSHFAAVCGMEFIDHIHAGRIVPGIREDFVENWLNDVGNTVTRHFGSPK